MTRRQGGLAMTEIYIGRGMTARLRPDDRRRCSPFSFVIAWSSNHNAMTSRHFHDRSRAKLAPRKRQRDEDTRALIDWKGRIGNTVDELAFSRRETPISRAARRNVAWPDPGQASCHHRRARLSHASEIAPASRPIAALGSQSSLGIAAAYTLAT